MQTPSKVSSLILATAAMASLIGLSGSPAFARGAGGSAGAGMSTGAGMQGNTSGMSSSHMSAQGQANTNGADASDRDTGKARAEDRMSASGLKHNHAGVNESVDSSTKAGASSNGR
jgi:hypothetical protein